MMTALQDLLASLPEAIDWLYHPPVVLTAYGQHLEFQSKLYALLTKYDEQELFITDGVANEYTADVAINKLKQDTYSLSLEDVIDHEDGYNLVLCCEDVSDYVLLVLVTHVTKNDVSVEVAFIITKDAGDFCTRYANDMRCNVH